MKSAPSKPPRHEVPGQKPREGWFATFTFLDVSGAIGSSQLPRWGSMISRAWRAIVRGLTNRSKARTVGV